MTGTRPSTPRTRRWLLETGGAVLVAVSVGGCSERRRPTPTDGGPDSRGASGARNTPRPALDVPSSLPNPALGNPDAAVVVDVYEDFACPHCETYHEESFPRLVEEYIDPGKIHYVFHDFPEVGPHSWTLAEAARAVQYDVGEAAFWTFADEIYRSGLSGTDAARLGDRAAAAVGADAAFVERTVAEQAFRAVVEREKATAKDDGVPFAPGARVDGTFTIPNYGSLSAMIDIALEEA